MEAPLKKQNADNDEVHLLDYLIVLVKYSRVIISISIAMLFLTYFYLFFSPNTYTAETRILPPQQNMTLSAQMLDNLSGGVPTPGKGVSLGGGGGLGAALMGMKSPGLLYANMLKGATVLDRIYERFPLKKDFATKEDQRHAILGRAKIIAAPEGIINIEVTDKDPKRAAAMANAFVEELNKLLQDMALQEAKDRLVFLENERNKINIKLVKAEDALRKFSEQKGVLQIDAQTKVMLEYIATLRASIDAKEVQIQVIRQHATPLNYDVINLEAELKSLKEKLHDAENKWDKACVGDVCLPTTKMPGLSIEFMRLYRDAKFQEGLYQNFIKMVEIARMDISRNVAVVQVIDRAKVPEKRANRRLVPAIIAAATALFITVFVVFIWEFAQGIKEDADEAQRLSVLNGYLQPWRETLKKIGHLFEIKRKYPR